MVLAIFNPFCCCTAAVFLGADDSDLAQAMHSCCESKNSDAPANGSTNDEHDPADCPHQALKDYQASLIKDNSASHDVSALLPALIAVIEFFFDKPVAQSKHAVEVATASAAPPIPLSQVYCVYRI
ncbi:MAG: hypothetical protein ACPGES_06985 [Coraliomargarita sp.]